MKVVNKVPFYLLSYLCSLSFIGTISFDIADPDLDGDVGIALGSHAVAKFPEGNLDPAWKQAKGLLILRNRSR